jgi:hypothetical protein
MAERQVRTVTRTVTVSDLTPIEMASVFASWVSVDQAAFFTALREESRDWPNSGWCGQAHYIVSDADAEALFVLDKLADHVLARRDE